MEECIADIIARFWCDLIAYKEDFERVCFILIHYPYWLYIDNGLRKYHLQSIEEKDFCRLFISQCDFLSNHIHNFDKNWETFDKYRQRVPTCGGILMNNAKDQVILVSSYKYNNRGFPKGKINEKETEVECAVREVKEETGIDISKIINEKEYIFLEGIDEKYLKLFVVCGIDEGIKLETLTRYEIEELKYLVLIYSCLGFILLRT